jgi:F-type H+-transporting ATPase subunit epsilon
VPVEVHLVTPEREVWSGSVQMVVAHGIDGDVGILGGHAPLLVRLTIGVLRIQHEDGTWESAVVDGGFLHVSSEGDSTRVDVLATDAELAREVDVADARRRLDENEHLAAGDDDAVKEEIAKAAARIEIATSLRS